jgi:small subunit ribosomal protein S17
MTAENTETEVRNRRTVQGLVTSTSMAKTITVKVTTFKKHPQYKKFVRKSNKYLAHDEQEQCRVGDLVTIVETRPMSARKRWRLRSVDRKSVS